MKRRCRIAATMLLLLGISRRRLLYLFILGLILVPPATASAALPDGWASRDIGDEGLPGSADLSGYIWTVNGSGAGIGGDADDFHYCYMQVSGDTEITARVVGITGGTNEWRKAGVMIRETLADNSSHAFMAMTNPAGTEHAAAYQSRADGNNNITYLTPTGYSSMPWWVRLQRIQEDNFTGSVSPDGVVWTDVAATEIVMAHDVYIGLAVTSHDNTEIATGTFDNVLINGLPGPYCPGPRNPVPADGSVVGQSSYCDTYCDIYYMILDYTSCAGAVSHTGYFSDNKADVDNRDPAHCLGDPPWPAVSETAFVVGYDDPTIPEFARAPLVLGTTYYWCVDFWIGTQYLPGPTWSFTPIPRNTWGPSPADGEEWVYYTGTMTWNRGDVDTRGYTLSYDIYIGEDQNAVTNATTASPEYTANVSTESYEYNILPFGPHFWRVDTKLRKCVPPFPITYYTGQVWSFFSSLEPPQFYRPDLYWDGIMNFKDFALFAVDWQQSGEDLTMDFSRNNKVNYNDLIVLTVNWLSDVP